MTNAGRAWGVAAGAFALAAVLLPVGWTSAALDPAAEGQRLDDLRLGLWLFKLGLAAHAGVCLAAWRLAARPRPFAPLWGPPPVNAMEGARTLLVAMVVAAAGLRLLELSGDLWLDEIYTLVEFVRLPLASLLTSYDNDNQHLLYSALARVSTQMFGEGPAALRLPAVLFGLASLPALFRLGRLLFGASPALLATALLAFSYHHVWFSQNARGYTGLLFASLLATELFLRGVWRGRWTTWIGYAATVALGMAVHLTMVFVAAAHGLAALFLAWRAGSDSPGRLRPVAALALAGLFSFQAHALLLPQLVEFFTRPGAGTIQAEIVWKNPIWLVAEAVRGLGFGLAFGSLGVVAAGALGGAGLWRAARRDPLSTALFVLPALLGGAALLILGRNLWPRFFFNSFGFAALLAVSGAWAAGEWVERRGGTWSRRPAGVAIAGLLVLLSATMLPRVYDHPKQDFSGARDFVLAERAPGERIVAVGLAADAYGRYYAPAWPRADSVDELRALQSRADATWVLYTLPTHLRATQPALADLLDSEFEAVRVFPGTLGDGAVIVRRSTGRYAVEDDEETRQP